MILYGETVNQLFQQNKDFTNGTLVANAMKNKTFNSPVNGEVQMDSFGDRVVVYAIKTFDAESGRFQVRNGSSSFLVLLKKPEQWYNIMFF